MGLTTERDPESGRAGVVIHAGFTPASASPDHAVPTRAGRRGPLAVGIVGFAAVLLVAGMLNVTATRSAEIPGQIATQVDGLDATWADYNGEGFLATVDEDTFQYTTAGFTFDAEATAALVRMQAYYGIRVEVLDEVIVGSDSTYYVERTARITTDNDPTGVEGFLVIQVQALPESGWTVTAREWFGPTPRY